MTDWHSYPALAAGVEGAQASPETFRAEDIHRQVERICASRAFRGSLRLTRFLSFIVETTLAGKSDSIKAYTIAVEALDRRTEFDPQSDPIVRVEAGRLRHALERYYSGPGRDDTVVIDMPRGTYVPSFQRRAIGAAPTLAGGDAADASERMLAQNEQPQKPQAPAAGSRIHRIASAIATIPAAQIFRIAFGVVAALAILEVLFDISQPFIGGGNERLLPKLWPTRDAAVAQSPIVTNEPLIYVEPVTYVGEPLPGMRSATTIRERLADALTRYDDVVVVADLPQRTPDLALPSNFHGAPPSLYRLASTVTYYPDGAMMLAARLIDMADGTIVWARAYDRPPPAIRHSGGMSHSVAQALLQPFGVIQAREAIKRADADPMKDPYRCILDANTYLRSLDPSLYRPTRDCLEHATADSHPLVGVFVKLSRLYMYDYEFGGASGPAGNHAALDRAEQMAVRAVDIKPTSALAQFAMEQVLLARHDFEQAKTAGENALGLNPNDNVVIFGHAARLILTGQVDDGMAALRQNINKKTAVWTSHHFLLALGSYLKGDLTAAEVEASQIANENFPPGLVLDALVAASNKNRLRARHDVTLLARYPSWRDDPRTNIGYFLPDHSMADRIGDDFAAVLNDLRKHADVVGSVRPAGEP